MRKRALGRQTAVKRQGLTGVIRRPIRKEPHNGIGNFFRTTDSAEGMNRGHALKSIFVAEHAEEAFRYAPLPD
jgi:hypothetical protein